MIDFFRLKPGYQPYGKQRHRSAGSKKDIISSQIGKKVQQIAGQKREEQGNHTGKNPDKIDADITGIVCTVLQKRIGVCNPVKPGCNPMDRRNDGVNGIDKIHAGQYDHINHHRKRYTDQNYRFPRNMMQ